MKKRNPALQVILAIGGWAFNDEGSRMITLDSSVVC
jgi:GH18 family chitinase